MRTSGWIVATACAATGCGRLRFDELEDAAVTPDIMADTSTAAPGFVSRSGGIVQAMTGELKIPPPIDANAGDLVVLYLDRFWETAALPDANGWHSVASLTNDEDAPQIFYRTAAANEASLSADYTFPAGTLNSQPDGAWALDVWHAAREAQMVFTTTDSTMTDMPAFPAGVAMANEVVIDASVAAFVVTTCSDPANVDNRSLWSLLTLPPGNVDAVSFTCTPTQTFGRFQIRIVP